ncbi:MAG: hypothetical protein RLZZ142_2633 [Verrucomicrobiota bacterium]|jgi:hypothetical protein
MEKALRSLKGNQPSFLTFKNATSTDIEVFWLDYQGQRKKYASLAPGKEWGISTFATHPWVLAEAGGKPLGVVVAGKKPGSLEGHY